VPEFAKAESLDQGKTVKQALDLEIPRCVTNLRFYADLLVNYHNFATDMESPFPSQSTVRHEPIGVVGVISPWNLPLYLLSWKVAPALAMGNCVVAKPSEMTSLTAFKLAELTKEAGFPDGVFNVVFGLGQTAGQAIVEHPAIRAISFTGGTVTGRKIAALAAPHGKKVSLELGGKNPAVIFEDCDMDVAVNTSVRAGFANQGEICLCCSRIFVQRSIYPEFIEKFVAQVAALKVGDPSDPTTDMGALVSKDHQNKVMSYIELAKKEGGKIHCGGLAPVVTNHENGFFVAPTVITNVDPTSRIMQEEIFGPVVCVVPFDTEADAIALANGVEYGLAASVWTVDGKRGQRVARQIKSGVVWINCWMVRDLSTPFGGVKASGFGREGGTYALEFFSDIKTITSAL
jgi:aminomuconate-semialdehyde/2-hydroxymuconate-6-semialdehyde dehydrogenase